MAAPDLWVAERALRFVGLEIGARMSVLRLSQRRLLVLSPIPLSDSLAAELSELGTVHWIVAPNRFHHLSVSEWRDAFPAAQVLVAEGLDEKRPELAGATVIRAAGKPWVEGIQLEAVQGAPLVNEVVFFHDASATLILTDLAFNMGAEAPLLTRAAFRLSGAYGRLGPTPLERLLVRDRRAFAGSLERILAWPFGRVIVAHGAIKEEGGREELVSTYAWAFEGRERGTPPGEGTSS